MIRFDSERPTDLVHVMTSAADVIDEHLNQLETEETALRDQWTGDARAAYDAARARWLNSMQGLNAALSAATRSATIAGQTLEEADQSVFAKWG